MQKCKFCIEIVCLLCYTYNVVAADHSTFCVVFEISSCMSVVRTERAMRGYWWWHAIKTLLKKCPIMASSAFCGRMKQAFAAWCISKWFGPHPVDWTRNYKVHDSRNFHFNGISMILRLLRSRLKCTNFENFILFVVRATRHTHEIKIAGSCITDYAMMTYTLDE